MKELKKVLVFFAKCNLTKDIITMLSIDKHKKKNETKIHIARNSHRFYLIENLKSIRTSVFVSHLLINQFTRN